MEIKISTTELKKLIGKKIKYLKKNSSIWNNATILEVHNRQINIGSDWISFDKINSILLLDESETNLPCN